MDQKMIFIIAGGVLILLLLIFFLVRKAKKGKKTEPPEAPVEKKKVTKYNTIEPSEEEFENAPKLNLIFSKDGKRSLIMRFEISGGKLKLDEINPYDIDLGNIHNYGELIGKSRQSKQFLRIFFNWRSGRNNLKPDSLVFNFVYRDKDENQWLQPILYTPEKVETKQLMKIALNQPEEV